MPDNKPGDAEMRYKKFIKRQQFIAQILLYFLLAIVVFIIIGFRLLSYSVLPLILSVSSFAGSLCIMIPIFIKLSARRKKLYCETYGPRTDYKRTGLFREIWNSYEYDQFEGLGDFKTKRTYIEDHNNTIELTLIRNRHEISILIDEASIAFLVDGETDSPFAHTATLSEFRSCDDFFAYITAFILDHS